MMCNIDGYEDGYNIQYYQERLYNLFINSIQKRVDNCERPIACLLSGGLDSSLIAAIVSRFYKKKETFSNDDIENFINENKDQLDIEYVDFTYAIINPQNLIGSDEFNQTFFDEIDEIEVKISNNLTIGTILKDYQIEPLKISNFRNSENKKYVCRNFACEKKCRKLSAINHLCME